MFKQKGNSRSVRNPDEITPEMRHSARMIHNEDDIEAGSVEMEEMPDRDRADVFDSSEAGESEEDSSEPIKDSTSAKSSRSCVVPDFPMWLLRYTPFANPSSAPTKNSRRTGKSACSISSKLQAGKWLQ